uniref:Uncharacterized protein n=1 Tax=viral metagenome TaxID=1070528 RepID=A0A6C0E5C9_9ZZZZ
MSKRKREDEVDLLINSFNKKIKIDKKRSLKEENFVSNKKIKINNDLEKENLFLKECLNSLLNEINTLKTQNEFLKEENLFLKNKDNLIDLQIYPLA